MNQNLDKSMLFKAWRYMGWIWIGLVTFLTLSHTLPVNLIVINENSKILLYPEGEVNLENTFKKSISIAHISAYGLLMWWFAQIKRRNQYLQVVMLFLIMGTTLEILQTFIPDRGLSIADMLSNWAGTILGWIVALFHCQIFDQRNSS